MQRYFRNAMKHKRILTASLFGTAFISQIPVSLEVPQTPQKEFVYNQKASQSAAQTYKLKTRDQHLHQIQSRSFDVIVIGGGATGSGVALECAQRGLSCVVIESDDFAQGASSKSTKLVHGGVRYLQQVFEISLAGGRLEKLKLVIEALRERSTFLTITQHFTKEVPILIPCSSIWQAIYFYSGSLIYHLIYKAFAETNTYAFKAPRVVGSEEIKLNYPSSHCPWGVLYSDGQFNDSRMVQELLLTSTLENYNKYQTSATNILNYAEVKSLLKDENGRLSGVKVLDKLSDTQFTIGGKVIVNATGCFADQIRLMDNPTVKKRIISAAGSHIILPAAMSSKKWGYLVPKTNDGRVLFIVPWMKQTLVGTTDRQLSGPTVNPTITFDEQLWLLKQFSAEFPSIPLLDITSSVKSKWTGIRPLVHEGYSENEKFDTKKVSRKHVIEVSESGLVSVMGGKWTIYRRMGEDTVDTIFREFKGLESRPSVSKHIKLIGEFFKTDRGPNQDRKTLIKEYSTLLQKQYNIPYEDAKYFIRMYGDRCFDIFKLNAQDPRYSEKLHPKLPHTVGEIVYLIRCEMAQKPQDILFRRISIGMIDSQIIYEIYPRISEIFAEEFKWDQARLSKELYDNLIHIRNLNY